ncbi:L-cystine import ATP-binding protein TcyC [Arthrobacter sp. Hiyo6]|nr:L-cystine import ATP-binding protein TcyC [Arthrobacter sp. Hiyo6]
MSPTESNLPDASALLTVRGLRKSFGRHEVLKSIDMDVRRGEVVTLIGPSGSGKTTVLRCLNGLEVPDAASSSSTATSRSIFPRRCRRSSWPP